MTIPFIKQILWWSTLFAALGTGLMGGSLLCFFQLRPERPRQTSGAPGDCCDAVHQRHGSCPTAHDNSFRKYRGLPVAGYLLLSSLVFRPRAEPCSFSSAACSISLEPF